MSDWHGILKILEVNHVRNGEVIWKAENLTNMLHTLGEQFILQCAFAKGTLNTPPGSYYFGLDGRATLAYADTVNSLSGQEPNSGGYARQAVSSENGFIFEPIGTSPPIYRATSQVITFTATGNFGLTVFNLFMCTSSVPASGILIASVALTQALSLVSGDSINVKMSVQLHDV
jgi:hypothetical protein